MATSVQIVYDARESRSIDDIVFQRYIELYNKKFNINLSFVKKQITIGDFVILNGNRVFAIFERKTLEDFRGSIINRRLDAQLDNMLDFAQKQNCHCFLILEGAAFNAQTHEYRGVAFSKMDAKKRSILYKGISIVQTKDTSYTIEQLVLFAVDAAKKPHSYKALRPDSSLSPFESSPFASKGEREESKEDTGEEPKEKEEDNSKEKIDEEKKCSGSSEIPKELFVQRSTTPTQTLFLMWCAMPQISDTSAPTFMKMFSIKEALTFCAEQPAEVVLEKIGGIEINGRTIGDKRAKKIYDGAKLKKTHINVLMQIKGISKSYAEALLRDHSITNLPDKYKFKNKNTDSKLKTIEEFLNLKVPSSTLPS